MSSVELDLRSNGRFDVLRRLGEGGMGVVYEAYDRERRMRVALKTLRTLSAEGILRFKNEFRALQDLSHPNLCTLGELISLGRQWFFTMELVDGVDLLGWVRPQREGVPAPAVTTSHELVVDPSPSADTLRPHASAVQRLERAARPPVDVARLRAALVDLARGVSALHAVGVVHRDIKPSNILVEQKTGRVVLLDFGLAQSATYRPGESDIRVVGTADYMAPEQASGRKVGPEADWYSVGVVLYEALTGGVPFSGAPLEVLLQKQGRDPMPPRALAPEAPADL
ncbi:MAG TPA: serine/threonine-protein kinase, partial [Polyangia bacterium]